MNSQSQVNVAAQAPQTVPTVEDTSLHAGIAEPAATGYERAEMLFQSGDAQAATEILLSMVEGCSRDWRVYNDLGVVCYHTQAMPDALCFLARAVELGGEDGEASRNLADALGHAHVPGYMHVATAATAAASRGWEGAATVLLRASRKLDGATYALAWEAAAINAVHAAVVAGRPRPAAAMGRQLLTLHPEGARLHVAVAEALCQADDPATAYFHLTTALRIALRIPTAHRQRADIHACLDTVANLSMNRFPFVRMAAVAVQTASRPSCDREDLGKAKREIQEALNIKSQNEVLQDAVFTLEAAENPKDPRFALDRKFCVYPFIRADVIGGFQVMPCCAAFLQKSMGSLQNNSWNEVWNSDIARGIRASIHDGTYRFCNKMTCSDIQMNTLQDRGRVADAELAQVVASASTKMEWSPRMVNLSYDKTCNLICPSCRSEKISADSELRAHYDAVTEREIIPMLRGARTLIVTGSGDPFASKTFRRLLAQLDPEEFPQLSLGLMTNGVLFTSREWERLEKFHTRLSFIEVSIDATTPETYSQVRCGGDWDRLMENLEYLSRETRRAGLNVPIKLKFVVQKANFREMPAFVELGLKLKVDAVIFIRLTNWNTFTPEEFADLCVWNPGHPLYDEFQTVMRHPLLTHPVVRLGSMTGVVERSD